MERRRRVLIQFGAVEFGERVKFSIEADSEILYSKTGGGKE
jgi:hypothetical protein